MKVSEIFRSIQGEGRYAGEVSAFVRLAGCDLACRWCDTGYARRRDGGRTMTVEQVVNEAHGLGARHIVVTGGEPLIEPELPALLEALHRPEDIVTLETAAGRYVEVACELVSISPKLGSSEPAAGDDSPAARYHREHRLNVEAIRAYMENYETQIKCVVGAEEDLDDIRDLQRRLHDLPNERIMLMPEARTKAEYRRRAALVAGLCVAEGYRFCPRLQVELWGNKRGH